jgi:hypothetical protein
LPHRQRANRLKVNSISPGGAMSEDAGSGVVTSYSSDGMRGGAGLAVEAGGVAAGAASLLRPAVCPAAAFGQVAGAAELAAGVGRAREAHTTTATSTHAAHVDLDARSRRAAGSGDGLTTQTTAVARSAGRVTAGMA